MIEFVELFKLANFKEIIFEKNNFLENLVTNYEKGNESAANLGQVVVPLINLDFFKKNE